MPVPKQRHTKSRRNKRRSHLALKPEYLSLCPKCGSPILPHHMCPNCGYYKGKEIINVLAKLEKKEKKQKEKELAQAEEETKKEKPLTMEGLSKR